MPERIEFERPRPVHRPGPIAALVGVARMGAVLVLAAVGALGVLAASLVPGRVRGVRPALWGAVALARLFVRLFGVRLRCPDPGVLRRHHGLVFINHLSYLDPVMVEALAPVRFLATAGVRRLPFIGWIARAVGTVFVDRGDDASRAASREALAGKLGRGAYPPIVIAPEGQIGPGGAVLPFRHGALAVARDAGVPVLPLVLRFEPFDAAVWRKGEWIPRALWRLAARTGPFTAAVTPLAPLTLGSADDLAATADALEARYDAVLSPSTSEAAV
jgi:1-acyl-sn-glycerol-3-phosphate acyltransferase